MNRGLVCLALVAAIFGCRPAIAADPAAGRPTASRFRIHSWTTAEGLPHNRVQSILQTQDGYLWFTTFDGLVRFDGVRFTVLNRENTPGITSNRFASLCEGVDGSLWCGTEDGGVIHFGKGRVEHWTSRNGLPDDMIKGIRQGPDGRIWISCNSGIGGLLGDRYTPISLPRGVEMFLGGTILSPAPFSDFSRQEIFRWRDGRFDSLAIGSGIPSAGEMSLAEDQDQVLWVATPTALYSVKGTVISRRWTEANGLPASRAQLLAAHLDRSGRLWVSRADGFGVLDGNVWRPLGSSQGLASSVLSIYEDREGTIWMGSSDGLHRASEILFDSISVEEGLSGRNVYALHEDPEKRIWIGTSGSGLDCVSGRRTTRFTRAEGLNSNDVSALGTDERGRLLVGFFHGGVSRQDAGRFHDVSAELGVPAGVSVWDIHADRNGALWFATPVGLYRSQDGRSRRYGQSDGLPSDDVRVLLEARDGTLWIGGYGGLARLSDGEPRGSWTEDDGLPSNRIRSLFEDSNGSLWIGTYDRGLVRFRNGRFVGYGTRQGLRDSGVFRILEDSKGNFWLSGNRGIARVPRKELEDLAEGKIAVVTCIAYGVSDGMRSSECNGGRQPAGLSSSDGRLWFPTQDGVVVVDPKRVEDNPYPPKVAIEGIRVNQSPLDVTGRLTLASTDRGLEIDYTGLSYIRPEQIRFRHRLEGLEDKWSEAGSRRTAYYAYVPPGSYRFVVTAANAEGRWNPRGVSMDVVVRPPFWRTGWFAVFASAGLAVGLGGLWRRRLRKERDRERMQLEFSRRLIASQELERKRIAAELHDGLAQSIVVIRNRALLGLNNGVEPGKMRRQIEAISDAAAQALSEVREIAYDLRPHQLDRLGLTRALLMLLERTAESTDIAFTIHVEPVDGVIAAADEIAVYRIVQEAVSNILRHSEARSAGVSVGRRGPGVAIRIEDDGKGFDREEPTLRQGLGLAGLSERVRILGGKYELATSPGQGTAIEIQIPGRKAEETTRIEIQTRNAADMARAENGR